VNPDSGTEGTFTPVATHEGPEGEVCREYAVDATIDGREEVVYGTACRRPDGSWVEANSEYSESDPPPPAAEVHSGTDWSWIIRNIAIAGGYCSSSFCAATTTPITRTITPTTVIATTAPTTGTSATIGTSTETTIGGGIGTNIGVGTRTGTALNIRSERTRVAADLTATGLPIYDREIAARETNAM